tara:strand:- start:22879 stop:23808 length:930 start_codon:yes stop_codon:yes gene_type:complete
MTILLIAEHDNKTLNTSTLNVVTAARRIGNGITMLIAGNDCAAVAEQAASIPCIDRVLLVNDAAYDKLLPEKLSALIIELAEGHEHILAAASSMGKDVMPRVAALLDVGQISEIIAVDAEDTFQRPIYAGNAIAMVQSLDPIKVITVRTSAFDKAASTGGCAVIDSIDTHCDDQTSVFIDEVLVQSDRPELAAASVIVSGGRGMGNGRNFELLEAVADRLNGAIGASRAAVDAGFVSNDLQVGQTGKIVAPDLYVAVGISGAIQHLAGMKGSKVIVAINKDPDAPIFQVADYGLVMDLFDALPELARKL